MRQKNNKTMNKKSTLYVTQGSGNSFKPMQVAAQLGLQCNVTYLDVLAGESRTAEFLSINPLGQLPYMMVDEGVGLGESNAIAWYLAEGSKLMPDTALTRAQSIRWMNYEQTMLEANISPVRFFTYIVPELEKDHEAMIPVWRERGNQGLAVLNNHLEKNDFVTDYGYSVADIAVYGYTHLADEGGFKLSQYEHVSAWIARIQDQSGYVSIDQLLSGRNQSLAA